MSARSRRTPLIALLMAIVLVGATAVWSAHGYTAEHEHVHCDLCVHFSGTAGSPAQAVPAGKPVLVVRAQLERPSLLAAEHRTLTSHLPRGPPFLPELASI